MMEAGFRPRRSCEAVAGLRDSLGPPTLSPHPRLAAGVGPAASTLLERLEIGPAREAVMIYERQREGEEAAHLGLVLANSWAASVH